MSIKIPFISDAIDRVYDGLTGKTQANAAKDAARMQKESADQAVKLQRDMYNQSRKDMAPWRNTGANALEALSKKVMNTPAYDDKYGNMMGNRHANGAYSGSLNASNFQKDPSYEFRRNEGMRGLQASASAQGGLLSGAALKALNQYNSNLASQEFQAAHNRLKQDQNQRFAVDSGMRSADYNMFNNENTRQYNQLANLAGVGQTAGQSLASLGQNYAGSAGNALMQGANASAAGRIGAANARTAGLGNILKLGGTALGGVMGGPAGASAMGGMF